MAGRKIVKVRLSEAAQLHYRYMESIHMAQSTVNCTRSVLRALEHVVGNKLVCNIDWQDVSTYFDARTREPQNSGDLPKLSAATVNLQVSRLRIFFDWAAKFHYMDSSNDPMHGRRLIKIIPEKRARVEAQDFPALLDATENPRDRMVVALGLYTLMRAGEIRGLRIGNVSLTDDILSMIRYKTREADELAICAELHGELANYLMWYSYNVGRELDNEWFLVPTNERRAPDCDPVNHRFTAAPSGSLRLVPAKPLYANASAVIVQRALRVIGWEVTAKEGGHTLRRSAARELFESLRGGGFDDALLVVMSWLGHKSPVVTMRYLGLQKEAERRNSLYKKSIMYPRAVRQDASNVVPLRAVGGADD